MLAGRPPTNILKYRDHNWDFSIIWTTRFLHTVIKESSHIWKLSLKVLKNHHWIQLGPDAKDFEVTGILCSFGLVIEGKVGQEIPEPSTLEFLEKFLANKFALSDTGDNTSGALNKEDTADLPLLRTLLSIRQK